MQPFVNKAFAIDFASDLGDGRAAATLGTRAI
jgi:hypothetical protein